MENAVNATKEDERKILVKFKKVVDSLGADSYIGSAFAGVWELAQENIDKDAAFSAMAWKAAADRVNERLEEQRIMYEKMLSKKEDETSNEKRLRNNAEAQMYNQERKFLEEKEYFAKLAQEHKQLKETSEKQQLEARAAEIRLMELQGELNNKDGQIIKLKAKLYDLAEKSTPEN